MIRHSMEGANCRAVSAAMEPSGLCETQVPASRGHEDGEVGCEGVRCTPADGVRGGRFARSGGGGVRDPVWWTVVRGWRGRRGWSIWHVCTERIVTHPRVPPEVHAAVATVLVQKGEAGPGRGAPSDRDASPSPWPAPAFRGRTPPAPSIRRATWLAASRRGPGAWPRVLRPA